MVPQVVWCLARFWSHPYSQLELLRYQNTSINRSFEAYGGPKNHNLWMFNFPHLNEEGKVSLDSMQEMIIASLTSVPVQMLIFLLEYPFSSLSFPTLS